jgi:hypothetical protein
MAAFWRENQLVQIILVQTLNQFFFKLKKRAYDLKNQDAN